MSLTLVESEVFTGWFSGLRDERARKRIAERMARVAGGNFGDTRSLGGGVAELKIDYGPGYRIYYGRHGRWIVLLLCGGDKSSQRRDIVAAREILECWRRDHGDEVEGL